MRSAKPGFWLVGFGLVSLLCAPVAHGTLVTVQSQTQEHMDALTAAVNGASASDYTGNARVTLGTIEATMSRVVDAESEYLVAVVQSVPTLRLLRDIAFNSSTQTWHLEYEMMNRDDTSDINQYRRTLYLTKHGNAHTGDHENACLSRSVSDSACLAQLHSNYIVPGALSQTADNLLFAGGIRSTLTSRSSSLVQTLRVSIPHTTVKNLLARKEVRTSSAFGKQTQYTFGVGVLFLLAGKNTVLFDSFELVENARAQSVIQKTVAYSIAKHVSFFTEQVAPDPRIRLVSVEYLVEAGHSLQNISATVNGREVSAAECALARARVLALHDTSCLQDRPICEITVYESADSSEGYSWVTYTMPIPAAIDAGAEPSLLVNTLLDTLDHVTGTRLWSSINFKTANNPRPTCTAVTVTTFNPAQYAKAVLYESLFLYPQLLSSTSHSVSNHTVNGEPALTMADALMTLVLSPGDGQDALDYFTQNPDEALRLDEVYMSHAKPYVQLPAAVHNVLLGVAAGDGTFTGRSTIILDSELVQTCPLESGAAFTYGANAFTCVTTQDWGVNNAAPDDGALERPHSAANTNFVYQVQGTAADVAWLQDNIFGSSAAGAQAAADFVARVGALTSGPRQAHSRTYWVWPLYAWPDEAPVGLKDKTVLSIAWSLSHQAAASGRRLLGAEPAPLPQRVSLPRHVSLLEGVAKRNLDLYRRHIDVQKLSLPYSGPVSARPAHLHVHRKLSSKLAAKRSAK